MKPVRISIVGVGGYAATHRELVELCEKKGTARLASVVIRDPSKPGYAAIGDQLGARGVRIHRAYDDLVEREIGNTDLIVLPTSIDQHESQSVAAMQAGFHVLCEKPVSGSLQQALRMKQVQETTGNILAIGYQHLFSRIIQKIKALTLAQKLGRFLSANALLLLPRLSDYYDRNSWAGKTKIGENPILDSPLHNAGSHFLNDLLYIAGDAPRRSAEIRDVYGENYRAKDIECADTQYIKITTSSGASLSMISTHACAERRDPLCEFHYEQGKIIWNHGHLSRAEIWRTRADHSFKLTDFLQEEKEKMRERMYDNILKSISRGGEPFSSIHNAWQEVLAIETSFASSNGVHEIPHQYLQKITKTDTHPVAEGKKDVYNTVINGIEKICQEMFAREIGFHEYKLPWAKKSRTVTLHQSTYKEEG